MFAEFSAHLVKSNSCGFSETLNLVGLRRLEDVHTSLKVGFLLCYEAGQIDFALVAAEENSATINDIVVSKSELG